MSQTYYYFVSTLPELQLTEKTSIEIDQFSNDCQQSLEPLDGQFMQLLLTTEQLDAAFFDRIEQANLQTRLQSDFYLKWRELFIHYYNEQAWLRAERLGKDPWSHIRGERFPEPALSEVLIQAFKRSNPAEAQQYLYEYLWSFLDGMGLMLNFKFEMIVIFGLKLRVNKKLALSSQALSDDDWRGLYTSEYDSLMTPMG